jgi:toxin ParE1/3/4
MTVTLHPAAEQDLEEAASFYEREGSPAVAARFLVEFYRIAQLLDGNPGLGTPRAKGRKGFPTTGFPYTVIYRPFPEGIRVLVVKHDRRRPSYGGRRY